MPSLLHPLIAQVARPDLSQATGYTISLQARVFRSDPDDMCVGVVQGVDVANQALTVRLAGLVGQHSDKGYDEESVPYESPDIAWMLAPLFSYSKVREKQRIAVTI